MSTRPPNSNQPTDPTIQSLDDAPQANVRTSPHHNLSPNGPSGTFQVFSLATMESNEGDAAITSPGARGGASRRAKASTAQDHQHHHTQQQQDEESRQRESKKNPRQLTELQLEKKRANDRQAQRAIRERTKKQIEALEQRIRDLESGEAYCQLQETVKQKEAIEAENYELRRRLGAIMDILSPSLADSVHARAKAAGSR